jgi:hypothetical protein
VGSAPAAGVVAPRSSVAPSAPGLPAATGATSLAAGRPGSGRSATATVPAAVLASTPVCAAPALDGTLEDTESTAGHLYARLVLTNHGAAACQLTGYPGVQFVAVDGGTFGAPAEDDVAWGPAEPVLLAPGGTANAVLRVTQPGIQRGCLSADQTKLAAALRVAPLGAGGLVRVELSTGGVTACTSPDVKQLLVGPFTS